jgi:hypothetical protein
VATVRPWRAIVGKRSGHRAAWLACRLRGHVSQCRCDQRLMSTVVAPISCFRITKPSARSSKRSRGSRSSNSGSIRASLRSRVKKDVQVPRQPGVYRRRATFLRTHGPGLALMSRHYRTGFEWNHFILEPTRNLLTTLRSAAAGEAGADPRPYIAEPPRFGRRSGCPASGEGGCGTRR